ncbi:hypothetical protein [Mucilaginibacter sp. OK283]|uniref:hypothetical protein n=1 Tax=Mucilaginibacter sp. OK283 TaxID=1881049 RepID=UPI0008CD34B5|nr:hypothetical protein [Mucilaginibacter sp. OK283]SEO67588.1 hypothetical protein SAMN05428947_103365 [Mucilaginibacter sp. OK283]
MVHDWNKLAIDILKVAEEKFGKRNPAKFNGLECWFTQTQPELCGDSIEGYTIYLSESTLESFPNLLFECSHELVHLLFPTTKEQVNFLEEGIATSFQFEMLDRYNFQPHVINAYKLTLNDNPKYKKAYELIQWIKPDYSIVIKQIREDYPDILLSDLTIEHLKKYPSIPKSIISDLLRKFNTDESSS